MINSNDFTIRRDSLIAEIERAFEGVTRGEGISLHEAIALDERASLEQQKAARKLDAETRWQDIRDKDISECCSALSFFDVKGFRYHIPAFMRAALRNFQDDPNGIRNSCEFHLTQENGKSLRQSHAASIVSKYGFSPSQVSAIAKFLRFVIDFDELAGQKAFLEAVKEWELQAQGSN